MQGALAKELTYYFSDEEQTSNINMYDIYRFIELMVEFNYPAHAAKLLFNWRDILNSNTDT